MSHGEPISSDSASTLRALLAEIGHWSLPRNGWRDVEEILAELGSALADGDGTAARRLTGELISAAPVRAEKRIDASEPAPPAVLERVNELVDTIDPPARRQQQPESAPATGEGDARSVGR